MEIYRHMPIHRHAPQQQHARIHPNTQQTQPLTTNEFKGKRIEHAGKHNHTCKHTQRLKRMQKHTRTQHTNPQTRTKTNPHIHKQICRKANCMLPMTGLTRTCVTGNRYTNFFAFGARVVIKSKVAPCISAACTLCQLLPGKATTYRHGVHVILVPSFCERSSREAK